MQLLLRVNFVVAVWMCIAANAWQFWGYAEHPLELDERFGPWAGRVAMAPLVLGGAQLLLWFRFYRFENFAARVAAACAGAVLAIHVVIQLLRASIDLSISGSGTWFYAYFAASHLAYALFARRADAPAA